MEDRFCTHCGQRIKGPLRNPDQRYCNSPECQRARKRLWQRQKMASDPDYRTNQKEARQAWRQVNAPYSRTYRERHPDYVERNRCQQRERNRRRRQRAKTRAVVGRIAKMDALHLVDKVNTGIYKLVALPDEGIAKMDALTVQLIVFASIVPDLPGIAKKDLIDLAVAMR